MMQTAGRWTEAQHYRTTGDFRRDVAETVRCLEENVEAVLPWDDVRRVIQAWVLARFRLQRAASSDRAVTAQPPTVDAAAALAPTEPPIFYEF
jgi:hypothetical protein